MSTSKEIKERISLLLTHDDPDTRRIAAEDLANERDFSTTTALTAALGDENKGVRDAAFRSLISIGGPTVARSIAHHIADENIATRNLTAKLLMLIGPPAIPAVLPFLRDPSKDVRKFAVDILGLIKSKEAIYYLIPLLKDPDANVLLSAVEALGNLRSTDAVDPLWEAYNTIPFAQAAIAEAWGKIGTDRARVHIMAAYQESIQDPAIDPILLFTLFEALANVGDESTLTELMQELDRMHGKLRREALHAVIRIAERCNRTLPLPGNVRIDLLDMLREENEELQLSAVKGLEQFEGSDIIRTLVESLGFSDDLDFLIFSQLLMRHGVFAICSEMLKVPNLRGKKPLILLVGKLAFEAIRSFSILPAYAMDVKQFPDICEAIGKELYSADAEMREIAIGALFRIDGSEAVRLLNEVFTASGQYDRIQLIDQLTDQSDRRALDFVTHLLDDDDEAIREAASTVLESARYSLSKRNTTTDPDNGLDTDTPETKDRA